MSTRDVIETVDEASVRAYLEAPHLDSTGLAYTLRMWLRTRNL